jgi:hypothetical protein
MKKLNLFIIIAAVIFISIATIFSSQIAKKNGELFKNENINGIIFNIGQTNGTSVFMVNNNSNKFHYLLIENNISFFEIAEKGDSVQKKPHGNYLTLIKNKSKKHYLFHL